MQRDEIIAYANKGWLSEPIWGGISGLTFPLEATAIAWHTRASAIQGHWWKRRHPLLPHKPTIYFPLHHKHQTQTRQTKQTEQTSASRDFRTDKKQREKLNDLTLTQSTETERCRIARALVHRKFDISTRALAYVLKQEAGISWSELNAERWNNRLRK